MMSLLAALSRRIDAVNEVVGKAVSWLAIVMVLVQFAVVVMRYIFGLGSIMMQESVVYMYAVIFMAGAGYTLLRDGHVRIDILYRGANRRRKALVNLVGVVIFLIPVSLLIWIKSFPYVASSWRVLEGSRETSGIPAVFLLKSFILVFAALLLLQGVSLAIRSLLILGGDAESEAPSGEREAL